MSRMGLVLAGALLMGTSAYAHHSYTDIQRDHTASIEGELLNVVFANPHVLLSVKTGDGRTYRVEWRSVSQLNRMGVTSDELKVGDRLVITASPARDANNYKMALVREIRRPADGWNWKRDGGASRSTN